MTQFNQTIVVSKKQRDQAPRGEECIFIGNVRELACELSKTLIPWGVKVYQTAKIAVAARLRQMKFWNQGAAPQTGELVRVRFADQIKTYFGYFSEQVIGHLAADFVPNPFPTVAQLPPEYHSFKRSLKKIGYDDANKRNLMFCTRRLRWLAIDFGPMSDQS